METNYANTLTHATRGGGSPTSSNDAYSVIKAKETQVTGNTQLGSNKRKLNRQNMYNMIKKTLLGHGTVTHPLVESVTQNQGTSDMKDDDTLLKGEGRHTDSTPIGWGSPTQGV